MNLEIIKIIANKRTIELAMKRKRERDRFDNYGNYILLTNF